MSDSEGEGDAFKITEEIVDDKEEEEKVVVREERFVNDQGKTVIRRVYKKKKPERKKKKRSKSRPREQKKKVGGFAGIPQDDDDDVPELQRLKLKSRKPKEPKEGEEGSDEDESIPEWQRKKLKSTNKGGAPAEGGRNRSESTVEEDVFNFRQLLKKRADSPVIERNGKIEPSSGGTDFRTMLKSRSPGGAVDNKAAASTGTEEEKPNFLSVLKPTKRAEEPIADKGKPEQEEKPNFLSVLKKNTTEPIEVHKSATTKEEPVWRQVRLRPSGATGSTTPSTNTQPEETKPKFGIGSLRKTEAGSTLSEEELAIKARESELKAIQRKNERLQKEEKEKAEKQLLVADIVFLRNQKETLLKEVEELTNTITKLRQEEKALKAAN